MLVFAVMTYPLSAAEFDIGLNGRVNLQGAILAKACSLAMKDKYQSIDMSSESIGRLKRTGEGRRKIFSLYLTGCTLVDNSQDDIPWHYLEVSFDGAGDEGLFKIYGNAKGVALQVKDVNGKIATPGKHMPFIRVDNKNIRLDYELVLKTNHDELRVGEYSSIIKYKVSYF